MKSEVGGSGGVGPIPRPEMSALCFAAIQQMFLRLTEAHHCWGHRDRQPGRPDFQESPDLGDHCLGGQIVLGVPEERDTDYLGSQRGPHGGYDM